MDNWEQFKQAVREKLERRNKLVARLEGCTDGTDGKLRYDMYLAQKFILEDIVDMFPEENANEK